MAMAWISASWWYNVSTPSMVGGGEAFRGFTAAASVWPPHCCWREPLPCPELGSRRSPSLGSSLTRVQSHAMASHAAMPQQLLPCRQTGFAIALPPARCWAAKRRLVPIAPPNERVITQMGGRCPAAAPPPAVDPSS
jgi:hypothetical protein